MIYSNFKPFKELFKVLALILTPVVIAYIIWILMFTYKNLNYYSSWDLSNKQNLNALIFSRIINLMPNYNIAGNSNFELIKLNTEDKNLYPLLLKDYSWNSKYSRVSLSDNNMNYKAKIKSKGESPFHFIHQDVSIKIKVSKKKLYKDKYRIFDLDKIGHPGIFNDVLAYEVAKELNLLMPEYRLVIVEFNQDKKFLRQFVGSLDEQLLRLNNKMPADIFTIKLTGKNRDNSLIKGANGFSSPLSWRKDAVNNHFNYESKDPIRNLLNIFHNVENNNQDINELIKLFDVDYLSRFLFFIQLTQSTHQDSEHNFSLFYDPWMQKFYPVVNDIMAWFEYFGNTLKQQIPEEKDIVVHDFINKNSMQNELLDLLKSSLLVKQRIKELSSNTKSLREIFKKKYIEYLNLAKNDPAFDGIYFTGSRLTSRSEVIKSLNLLYSYIDKSLNLVDSYEQPNLDYQTNIKEDIILKDKLIFYSTKDFSKNNVKIKSGATILLGPDVNIIFSNVKMLGNKNEPIIIKRLDKNKPFGAVVIKESDSSLLRYVSISGGSGFKNKYYKYTGQFSAHDVDDLIIEMCKFSSNSDYDDNVHLVYVKNFLIKNTVIENSPSDGIDIDISKGKIENSVFLNNGNDGLDLMTSNVYVSKSTFINNGDKGISVGENSNLNLNNSTLDENYIGIEVKDKSTAILLPTVSLKSNFKYDINLKKKNYRFSGGGTIKIPLSLSNANIKKDNFSKLEIYK
tara:strand:- start:1771 stop:3978 length:2208 start_codon:yes stop_codon:yes gene_type:complete